MPKVSRKPIYKTLVELPPLPAEDREGLRMSIAASGVIVPIIVWPKGKVRYIIDGSHRKTIADELGYECPELLRPDLDEEEARVMARALNLARRQLDREQKRQIIADQLHESPERSARWIGKMLGVDHKTVISVREELLSGGEFPHLDTVVGRDGKRYSVSTVSHERYTPSGLIDAVRQVLGQIDLDPASTAEANKVVKAKSIFTKRTNGLKKDWHGRVFLNPPFDAWPSWMSKLDEEIMAGRVKQAIVVGPANISAFRSLFKRNGLLLIPDARPKFYDPESDELVDPPFGSLICYVGREGHRFIKVFGASGVVLQPVASFRDGPGGRRRSAVPNQRGGRFRGTQKKLRRAPRLA